jgi:transcriptional regulator with XRE-family HTH domain
MPPSPSEHHIGELLRLHREEIGLSIRTLASRAGCSPSFISQVENGVASPSIGSLEKIAACLGVSLSRLFHEREGSVSSVVRAKDRPRVESGWSNAVIESLRSDSTARIESLLITIQPGGTSGKSAHAVTREQFVFVISGEVRLDLHDTQHVLTKGDAVTIRSQAPARWTNHSTRPVQLLFVSAGQ